MKKRILKFTTGATMVMGAFFFMLNSQPVQAQACGEPDERITSDPRVCIPYSWDCDSDGSQQKESGSC